MSGKGTSGPATSTPPSCRLARSTEHLDALEAAWWDEHADLEDRYCWVQPAWVRRSLRGRYVRNLLGRARSGGTVLELGCGTGWLAVLFAEAGATAVVGMDGSSSQVALASAAADVAGVSDRVRFTVGTGPEHDERYDLVVLHAFLHHLSTAEVKKVMSAARRAVRDDGLVVLIEPVLYPCSGAEPVELKLLRRLERLPMSLVRRRLRRLGPTEAAVRDRLSRRHAADAPGGPSPKELPFDKGELEALAAAQFEVVGRDRCLGYSHLVAQEALIAALSQPLLWGALLRLLVPVAGRLDRRLLHHPSPPVWVFEAFWCRPRREPR